MHTRWKVVFLALSMLMSAVTGMEKTSACTEVVLSGTSGVVVSGRTMDFDSDLGSRICFRSAGTGSCDSNVRFTKGGFAPLSWTSKYDCVFIDGFEEQAYTDGMNSKGLSAATLWQTETEPASSVAGGTRGLSSISIVQYILENAATVDEAKALFSKVSVFLSNYKGADMLLHWIVTEASGRSLVIELKAGRPVFFDDVTQIGVMTNSPTYDKQVANLQEQTQRLSKDPDSGLPGDYRSSSRFVKAAYLVSTTPKLESAEKAMQTAIQILHNVEVPKGAQSTGSYTQWITVRDQKNLIYWFVSPSHLAPITIDLKKVNFKTASSQLLPIEGTPSGDAVELLQRRSVAGVSVLSR